MRQKFEMENRKDLLSIIREYESAIETLTAQIDFYAHEQEHLRKELSNLVEENKNLSKTLREIIESKSAIQPTDKENLENNLVNNLKKQLTLTLQEKETVVQLWQNSLRNIDQLEEELRMFSGKTRGFFSKEQVQQMKSNYETQIRNLEDQLEKLHIKLQTILKTSSQTLEDKNFDLEKAFLDQKTAVGKMRVLEDESKILHNKIKDIVKMRDKLEDTLKNKNKVIDELKTQVKESKEKVSEAVQIVDAALREKDAALIRENQAKDEIVKTSKTLSEVLDEASLKIRNDVNAIKLECDEKIKQAQIHVDSLKEEMNNKTIELQKSEYEYKLLKYECEKVKRGTLCLDEGYTSKMLIFDKNLETTFQKLVSSERNVVKIGAEKEQIRVELQQLTASYHSDIKKYQTDNESLREELMLIKKKLKKYQRNLAQATEEATKLKFTLNSVESKDKYVQSKLQSYLDEEIGLNKKWKKGMRDIVQNYEKQINKLKSANVTLKHKLKRMFKEVVLGSHSKTEINVEIDKTNKVNEQGIQSKTKKQSMKNKVKEHDKSKLKKQDKSVKSDEKL